METNSIPEAQLRRWAGHLLLSNFHIHASTSDTIVECKSESSVKRGSSAKLSNGDRIVPSFESVVRLALYCD